MSTRNVSRRGFLKISSAAGFGALLAACGGAAPAAAPTAASGGGAAPQAPAAGGSTDQLIAAAKQEGQLTLIALPDDWSNYGEIKKAFSDKYGIKVSTLNPD